MPRVPWHTPAADSAGRPPFSDGPFPTLLRAFPRVALSLALVVACESGRVPGPGVQVQLSAPADSVEIGATLQLNAVVANAADTAVSWRSSDTAIASVSASGLVTGVALGRAGITAIARADTMKRATRTVGVVAGLPAAIRIEADTYAVPVGTPTRFSAVVTNRAGGPVAGVPVQWNSFYARYSTMVLYDTIWNRSLDPPVTVSDAQGRATATATIPVESRSRLIAQLATGPADTALVAATLPAESPLAVQWSQLPSMPWSRAGMGAAAHGERIYLFGGWCHELSPFEPCAPGGSSLPALVFTPAMGAWENFAPPDSLALPSSGIFAADLPDGIHLLERGRHLLYVPESGHWSARTPPWPDTLTRPALLVALQGSLYAVSETGQLRRYVAAGGDSWSARAPMPHSPGWGPAGAVLGGQLYVAGGGGYFDEGRQLTRYDPVTDAWSALPDMPYGRSDMGSGVVTGRLCVFSGGLDYWIGPWSLRENYCYDPAANAWLLGPASWGCATGGLATVTLGDRVYVFGGSIGMYKSPANTTTGVFVLAPR